jgi:hypothetical protein
VTFVVDEVALEQVFLRFLPFPPVDHHPTIVPYNPTRCAIALTKQRIILPSALS